MLRDALFLARMDARYMLSRRETLVWTFIMPVLFFYFIGAITGNSLGNATRRDPVAVRLPSDAGFLAVEVTNRLDQAGYRIVRAATEAEYFTFARRLEFPAAFTASILANTPVQVHFVRVGSDLDSSSDRVRINRALYSVVADVAVIRKSGAEPTPESVAALNAEPHNITLSVASAGKRLDPPTGFEQSVPGTMVMFTLLVLFTAGAVTLTLERRHGILRRLASSPMSRGSVVLGKFGARMALGGLQIAFAMLTGRLLFHVNWGPNLPVVLLVLLAYGALVAALAMLLGNVGSTEGQVIGMGVVLSNVLAGLGGCWWPVEVTPAWAQKLALFLPTGLTMNALHSLVNFGAAPSTVLPHLAALFAAAAIALFVLSKTFRFQ